MSGLILPDSVVMKIELSGVGGGWTDISGDLTDEDIVLDYGIKNNQPQYRCAGAGTRRRQRRWRDRPTAGTGSGPWRRPRTP